MTRDEALKLKPGIKVRPLNGSIGTFEGLVTKEFPPFIPPTVYCEISFTDGTTWFMQPRDMGPFEVIKDDG